MEGLFPHLSAKTGVKSLENVRVRSFCAQKAPRFEVRLILDKRYRDTDIPTVGMPLQTLHFAYLPDERAFLSERPFYKGKPRLKVRLIPESRYQAADIYFCGGLDSAPLCENWSEIAQK